MPTPKLETPRETWMDWQPKDMPAPAELLTRQEVADSPLLAGAGVTPTRLKMWEYRNVLPKAIRRSHHRKVQAVYPPWAPLVIAKLVELQRLGVPTAEIRPSLHQYAQALLAQAPEIATTNVTARVDNCRPRMTRLRTIWRATGRCGQRCGC